MAFTLVLLTLIAAHVPTQEKPRNIWAPQYTTRTPEEMAAQFESDARPVFRHRHDIVRFIDPRPGWTVAEIGAGSGFLSRLVAAHVGPKGVAIATELNASMVRYMNTRAAAEGITNFRAVVGGDTQTGLAAGSVDAVAVVNTYSFFERPAEMMKSIADSLRAGGTLVIIDFPRDADGGADPQQVKAVAATAGFEVIDSTAVIPGHFGLRFRKK
jgi:ubiquinone/menaquinone biosynthesis C-methylase UbiE